MRNITMDGHPKACLDNSTARNLGEANVSGVQMDRRRTVVVTVAMSMMIIGLLGNILAMFLIYKSYRKKGSKKNHCFLLCVGALALTDFLGKLMTGPIAINVYMVDQQWVRVDPFEHLCQFFGVCMTMFSLSPLFIASAMAIERTLAVHFPLWYSSKMGSKVTVTILLGIWLVCLVFALLPLAGVGRYTLQWPGTWCFISIDREIPGTLRFATAYVSLGLLSLTTTFVCNLATIKVLVIRCKSWISASQTGGQWGRIMIEALIQLLGITCVLFVCWTPLMVNMLKMIVNPISAELCMKTTSGKSLELQNDCYFYLLSIRLACVNQILDPWVYLLLKWILLQKCCRIPNSSA